MKKAAFARLSVALGLVVSSLFAIPQSAVAWVASGCSWDHHSVHYSDFSGYVYAGPRAIDYWNATPTPMLFWPASPESDWELAIYATDFGNNSKGGITTWVCDPTTHHFHDGVRSEWNTYYTYSLSQDERVAIMDHELGHGLGLAHAGSYPCSGQPIMYSYYTTFYETCHHIKPQQDDINGVNAIY